MNFSITWTVVGLVLSLSLNLGLLWYVRQVLSKLLFIAENQDQLFKELDDFTNHIESVHELEMYYGDTVLQELMRRSKEIVEVVRDYEEIFSLVEVEEETEELADEEEEINQEPLF